MSEEIGKIQEEALSDQLYHEYFHAFLDELSKMDSVKDFVRDDRYFGHEDDLHIQYKFRFSNGETYLMSKDGHRAYEFLIEFDKKDTAYGIYYGCRAYICEGDQAEENKILTEEWNLLRGEASRILNNTFVNKDFSKRFRPTNNAENRTFWPFWITLEPEEDIVAVAARATALIASVYKRFLQMNPKYYHPVLMVEKRSLAEETAFTNDRYEEILSIIRNDYGAEQVKAYKTLFKAFVEDGYFVRCVKYEKAWKLTGRLKIAGLTKAIHAFCNKYQILKENGKGNAKSIPWEFFDTVILSANEEPITFLRKSYSLAKDNDNFERDAKLMLTDMGL